MIRAVSESSKVKDEEGNYISNSFEAKTEQTSNPIKQNKTKVTSYTLTTWNQLVYRHNTEEISSIRIITKQTKTKLESMD
uniref:Putative ovule protein n=1 Tax=Solanum chacoense TaxID=4108 RepID=A0A0V0H0A8_SOLCH